MTVLVLGATGLLGHAVMKELKARGIRALGAARSGTDLAVDISNRMALFRLLCRVDCQTVINCAANINLAECEADPEMAYKVNGAPVGVLAAWSLQTDNRFIQISTDNYFEGSLPVQHDEQAAVKLKNVYAASKFGAETMALKSPLSLVLRTNICGAEKGFGKWALDGLLNENPISLFNDYFTSTMHVGACAQAIIDLMLSKQTGLMNLASREVSSKAQFVHAMASELGITLDWAVTKSAAGMAPERALSCGLDVSRAEQALGRHLPDLKDTVRALIAEDARCVTLTNLKSAIAV